MVFFFKHLSFWPLDRRFRFQVLAFPSQSLVLFFPSPRSNLSLHRFFFPSVCDISGGRKEDRALPQQPCGPCLPSTPDGMCLAFCDTLLCFFPYFKGLTFAGPGALVFIEDPQQCCWQGNSFPCPFPFCSHPLSLFLQHVRSTGPFPFSILGFQPFLMRRPRGSGCTEIHFR